MREGGNLNFEFDTRTTIKLTGVVSLPLVWRALSTLPYSKHRRALREIELCPTVFIQSE